MKPATLVIDGTTYTVSPITVDQAEVVFDSDNPEVAKPDMRVMIKKLVSASAGIELEKIGSMPFHVYTQLRDTALEINGLKPKGEAEATEKVTVN